VKDAEAPLSARDPVGRFTNRAVDYARWRPGYPEDALDAVLEGLGDPARLEAADVGAGTGISARWLAGRGVSVVALEPNASMRAEAEPHPRVRWVEGTAEATGLPTGSVDLVVCAQAFHWFRPTEALAEFRRILRPGGRVALVWNDRAKDDPVTAEFSRLVREASHEDPAALRIGRGDDLESSPLFRGYRLVRTRHAQPLDAEGLVGRALSASYVPKEGPARERLVAALRALPARFGARDGRVALVYETRAFLAEAASR
jgi:SAM-dependent methyltransferase